MTHQLINAYNSLQQVQIDGRETDKRALLNCASRLKAAIDDGGQDMHMYREAIKHNQHLWTLFQVALADPANQLPEDLKLTLLRLSGYIDRVSFRAVTEFLPAMLQSMIDINRIIAAGLAKKPEQTGVVSQQSMAMIPDGTPAAVMTSA